MPRKTARRGRPRVGRRRRLLRCRSRHCRTALSVGDHGRARRCPSRRTLRRAAVSRSGTDAASPGPSRRRSTGLHPVGVRASSRRRRRGWPRRPRSGGRPSWSPAEGRERAEQTARPSRATDGDAVDGEPVGVREQPVVDGRRSGLRPRPPQRRRREHRWRRTRRHAGARPAAPRAARGRNGGPRRADPERARAPAPPSGRARPDPEHLEHAQLGESWPRPRGRRPTSCHHEGEHLRVAALRPAPIRATSAMKRSIPRSPARGRVKPSQSGTYQA